MNHVPTILVSPTLDFFGYLIMDACFLGEHNVRGSSQKSGFEAAKAGGVVRLNLQHKLLLFIFGSRALSMMGPGLDANPVD